VCFAPPAAPTGFAARRAGASALPARVGMKLSPRYPPSSNRAYTPLTSFVQGRSREASRWAGRGAAPAGLVATRRSGGTGAPSGLTTKPCQELADEAEPKFDPASVEKAGPAAATAAESMCSDAPSRVMRSSSAKRGSASIDAHVARREAPAAIPKGSRSYKIALFGAPSPSGDVGWATSFRCPRERMLFERTRRRAGEAMPPACEGRLTRSR
jgi:hypothetical protein